MQLYARLLKLECEVKKHSTHIKPDFHFSAPDKHVKTSSDIPNTDKPKEQTARKHHISQGEEF
jgi:hypothetical protein